jgi:predicted DNA-binding protein
MEMVRLATSRLSKAEKRHLEKKSKKTGHSINTLIRELIQRDMMKDSK